MWLCSAQIQDGAPKGSQTPAHDGNVSKRQRYILKQSTGSFCLARYHARVQNRMLMAFTYFHSHGDKNNASANVQKWVLLCLYALAAFAKHHWAHGASDMHIRICSTACSRYCKIFARRRQYLPKLQSLVQSMQTHTKKVNVWPIHMLQQQQQQQQQQPPAAAARSSSPQQ